MIFIPVKYIRPGKNVQEAEQGQGFAWVHAGLFFVWKEYSLSPFRLISFKLADMIYFPLT